MHECGGASISEERDRVLVTLKWKTDLQTRSFLAIRSNLL